jgi:hypothetical protein
MPDAKSAHKKTKGKKLVRATRKQLNPEGEEKRKWNGMEGGGPGRPKGSTLDPTWKLTPNQMDLCRKIIEATNEEGFFPASLTALARDVDTDPKYLREMLRRDKFQAYLNHLLLQNGIMLEMAFWRGMQIGLTVGDARVLQLYAQMTGKIAKKESTALKVELVAPDGSRTQLPVYKDEDIVDAEVIEDDEDEVDEYTS